MNITIANLVLPNIFLRKLIERFCFVIFVNKIQKKEIKSKIAAVVSPENMKKMFKTIQIYQLTQLNPQLLRYI